MLSQRLAMYVHAYTEYWHLRPFGVSSLLAVYDDSDFGPQLYCVEPSGECLRYYGVAVGKNAQAANRAPSKPHRTGKPIYVRCISWPATTPSIWYRSAWFYENDMYHYIGTPNTVRYDRFDVVPFWCCFDLILCCSRFVLVYVSLNFVLFSFRFVPF